jgi:hypothetical protein
MRGTVSWAGVIRRSRAHQKFPKIGLLTLKQRVQLKGQGRLEGEKLMLEVQGGSLLLLTPRTPASLVHAHR